MGPQGARAGVDLVQEAGSLLMMREGATPPAGYTRVGTFVEERVDGDGNGGRRPIRMRIVIWQKM